MSSNDNWNFGEGDFPSIEIDLEYFKSLSKMDRMKYVMKLFFQEKDLGNRINMLNYVIGTLSRVGRVFIKNKEFQEYLKLLENGTKLVGVSAALGNMIKAKQTYRHTKNNEIAKLMGYPNGNYVNFIKMDVTQAMLEAFIDMSDHHKTKYNIKIENTVSDKPEGNAKKDAGEDAVGAIMTKIMMTGHMAKEEDKWGLIVNSTQSVFEDQETTNVSNAKLFYPTTGSTIHCEDLKEQIQHIMFELYIEKVDTRRNFVRINGTQLEICERLVINENIRNIDIEKLRYSIEKTLKEGRRRGIMLVGEPGVGKTISLHKLVNYFPNNLVFFVNADSISTVMGIRSVFKIFEMFKNSIMIFDDIDSVPHLTGKNEVTNEFLIKLDGTSKLTGFVIATVNDPSKIHPALINRPERFDEAILVRKPQEIDEVSEILFLKAKELGYATAQEVKEDGLEEGEYKGLIKFSKEKNKDPKFKKLLEEIVKAGLTQVQVSGLVGHCHEYSDEISLKSLTDAFLRTTDSIHNSMLVSKKGRLELDRDEISAEGKANLASSRSR